MFRLAVLTARQSGTSLDIVLRVTVYATNKTNLTIAVIGNVFFALTRFEALPNLRHVMIFVVRLTLQFNAEKVPRP